MEEALADISVPSDISPNVDGYSILLLLFYYKCAIIDSMKNLRVIFSGVSLATILALIRVSTSNAQGSLRDGVEAAQGIGQPSDLFGDGAIFTTIVNTMLFLIGAIAVIMLIYGGFRYVISGGNAASVTAAKNTILYAIVGVIVALLGYAIIEFVLNALEGGTGTGL